MQTIGALFRSATLIGTLVFVTSARATPTPTPTPTPVPLNLSCDLKVDNTLTNLNGLAAPENLPQDVVGTTVATGSASVRFTDFYMVSLVCKSNKTANFSGQFDVNLNPCSSVTEGFCIEDFSLKPLSFNYALTANDEKKLTEAGSKVLIFNKGGKPKTLNTHEIRFRSQAQPSGLTFGFDLPRAIQTASLSDNPTCRVVVSGAVSGEGSGNNVIEVTNGTLQFKPVVDDAVGDAARIRSVRWNGGPDQTGRWGDAPTGAVSEVTATVTTITDRVINCNVRVRPQGEGFTIKIQRFGDCRYFSELRNYYFTEKVGGVDKPRTGGYSPPLRYPGIEADYGKSAPDVPFKGFLNGAADLSGNVVVGLNGVIQMPPLSQRFFSRAIVVAKTFNTSTNVAGNAVYWGILDYTNFQNTKLYPVPGAQTPADDETLVFQLYLAGAQRDGNRDLRGTSDGIAYHEFIPASDGSRMPFDRIVPLMNETCIPMFQVSPPQIQNKPLTNALAGGVSCTYSRPFKFSDFQSGRVSLTAMYLVPEHAFHQYPTDLLKSSFQAPCVASNPNDTVACWDIKASQIGQSTATDPYSAHDKCREVKVIDVPTTYCGRYGCWTINVPTTVIEYKGSCNVIETEGECGKTLAIRFTGYNQMLGAALGCAVKYQRSGEVISPTLRNQGIMPYTSFGGSAPRHYENYTSNLLSQVTTPSGTENAGYACVPCRFATEESSAGRDIYAETKPLPVDQDSSTPRKPLFKFDKITGPRECVRNIEFEVRYFGSGACNGVNAPPGHFCTSENVTNQNCQTSDTSGAFSGGGNVAGKFRVPVCPGSGFEYDSVAVSWSPIILDVSGNGITVSRDFPRAVKFDIKGNGKATLIDWPVNVNEVALLALPRKGDKVDSIKELFGDFKAKNGFEALRKYDVNKDNRIDSQDKIFTDLKLWFDRNRNALADPGELMTLDAGGVESISLEYTKLLDKGIEGKTLSALYFNKQLKRFMNVEDHFFYEYKDGKKIEGGPKKK